MRISKRSKPVKQTDTDNMHDGHVASCLCCDMASYYESSPGYSEMTPGREASMSCDKGHWKFDDYLNSNLLVFMHDAARRCIDFVPRDEKA